MKNNENDIIDIPTELEIESPGEIVESLESPSEVEVLSAPTNSIESLGGNDGQEILSPNVEQTSNMVPEASEINPNHETATNNNTSPVTEPKIESIDGNPDVLDIEVRNLETTSKSKSKKSLKIFLIILLCLLIVAGVCFAYYKYILNNKEVEQKKELKLQVSSLSTIYNFEEAYNQKTANLKNKSEGTGTLYEISSGSIKFTNGATETYLSIEETRITAVSYLTNYKNNEVIAIKDALNNYYFAHIDTNIKEDLVLNYENSNLIKINSDQAISNVSVAKHLNSEELFYIAIKNGQNNFINVEKGEIIDISSINSYIYNGINIDVSDLKINETFKNKLKINGVGLFYDGSLYIYKGNIKDINEIEVKNNDESFDCEKIFVAYNEELEFFDLYVITYDKYLYKINLLDVDIDTKKVDIKKYESKISEYTIFENDINSVDIIFENGETIKLK